MRVTKARVGVPATEEDLVVVLRRGFTLALGAELGAEALSEALLCLAGNRDRVLAMDNPAGYLFTVGRQRASSERRRLPAPLFPTPADAGIPDVEPSLVTALGQLSERQRVCVVLVHGFGYHNREVADLAGISVASVQTHCRRGLKQLRKTMGITE